MLGALSGKFGVIEKHLLFSDKILVKSRDENRIEVEMFESQ